MAEGARGGDRGAAPPADGGETGQPSLIRLEKGRRGLPGANRGVIGDGMQAVLAKRTSSRAIRDSLHEPTIWKKAKGQCGPVLAASSEPTQPPRRAGTPPGGPRQNLV